MNAPERTAKSEFRWDDPFLLEDQLSEEERMVRDSARAYCQEKLLPRVLEATRKEKFDREILNEMVEPRKPSARISFRISRSNFSLRVASSTRGRSFSWQ